MSEFEFSLIGRVIEVKCMRVIQCVVHWECTDVLRVLRPFPRSLYRSFQCSYRALAPEFESFWYWSFWSFKLYSPECVLTRYAILCFHSSYRLEFWVLVLYEVMSETYWYPTWLLFYLHHGTSLQYFRRFARRQIRWSRRWCNGITQTPLTRIN